MDGLLADFDSGGRSDGATESSDIYSDPAAMFKSLGIGQPGGLQMPTILSPEDVRSTAEPLAQRVRENWTKLHGIVQRHEATIQKRWMKKSIKQRRSILLLAWPNMS